MKLTVEHAAIEAYRIYRALQLSALSAQELRRVHEDVRDLAADLYVLAKERELVEEDGT